MFKVRIIKIDWLDYDSKEADVFLNWEQGSIGLFVILACFARERKDM